MTADGVQSADEEVLFAEMRHEMRLDGEPVPRRSIDELCPVFTTPESRRIVLLELATLALSDGLAKTEHSLISDLARRLEVDSRQVTRVYEWAFRLARLKDDARKIIAGVGGGTNRKT